MSWWNAVAGAIFGRRGKGDPKTVVEEATTGIIAGIDKIWYTDEERADNKTEVFKLKTRAIEAHTKFVENTASENSARSIARREIAQKIIDVWLTMMILNTIVYLFDEAKGKKMYEVVEVYGLPTAVLMVLGFYFSLYALDKVTGAWGKKK
jgi:hypothetical protein